MRGFALATIIVIAALSVGVFAGETMPAASQATASTVRVRLVEFKVIPAKTGAPAGRVTFVVRNAGSLPHNFVVLRTNLAPGNLPTVGNVAKEVGRQGKTPAFGPGRTRRLTLTLRPGKYVLICNVPGHYQAGMFAGFRIR